MFGCVCVWCVCDFVVFRCVFVVFGCDFLCLGVLGCVWVCLVVFGYAWLCLGRLCFALPPTHPQFHPRPSPEVICTFSSPGNNVADRGLVADCGIEQGEGGGKGKERKGRRSWAQ